MATLMQKLQLKEGQQVAIMNASAEIETMLRNTLPNINIVNSVDGGSDAILFFAQMGSDLDKFVAVEKRLKAGAMVWIAYPKKSSKLNTDLTRDAGWGSFTQRWQGARMIALNADWSVLRFTPKESESDLLAAQYGKNAAMQAIHETIEGIVLQLEGVTRSVRKNYVAYVHNKQFVRIHPSTKTRVDLALALKDTPFTDRLADAGRLGDSSFTHKVELTSAEQIDDQVAAWLRLAHVHR